MLASTNVPYEPLSRMEPDPSGLPLYVTVPVTLACPPQNGQPLLIASYNTSDYRDHQQRRHGDQHVAHQRKLSASRRWEEWFEVQCFSPAVDFVAHGRT